MLRKSALIISGILFLVILECVSHAIIPNSKLNTIESILQVLQEDSDLLWRQRPYLNTEFQGVNVATNSLGLRNQEVDAKKGKHQFRVICLGASPTFGWGVKLESTYPFVLERMLMEDNPSGEFEVINAGQIGYSTHQGFLFFEKYLLRYSPDLVTVSYILNDIDRYKFYRNEGVSDEKLSKTSSSMIKLKNTLPKSRLLLFLRKGIFSIINLVDKNERTKAKMAKKEFNLAKVRVSQRQYSENLQKIINLCKYHNIKLIFIKMPVNLSLPQLSQYDEEISKNNNLSTYYYKLGCEHEGKHEYNKAYKLFKKAKDYLVLNCSKDVEGYQRVMEEVAEEYNIPLADAAETLISAKKHRAVFNGPRDPIHPNAEGHRLIAEIVNKEILGYRLLEGLAK